MTRITTIATALLLLALIATPAHAGNGNVSVKVMDAQGQPVADADLFFIVKSWPNGRYQLGLSSEELRQRAGS